jgi:hypothetical protein
MSGRTIGARQVDDVQPNVSFYLNRSTGFWFANVYWPDTQDRKRYSLRISLARADEVEQDWRNIFLHIFSSKPTLSRTTRVCRIC